MLGITQADLAVRAGISTTGLNNIETNSADSKASTLKAIRAALEGLGIEFIDSNDGGAGVRLAKRSETVADLTRQIDTLQTDMTPAPGSAKPSPNRAMKQLRHARDQNKLVALKNRRATSRKEEKK